MCEPCCEGAIGEQPLRLAHLMRDAIRRNQTPSDAIRRDQMQAAAISRNQPQSAAISRKQPLGLAHELRGRRAEQPVALVHCPWSDEE